MKSAMMWNLVLIPWYVFGAFWAISFFGVKPTRVAEKGADRLKTLIPIALAFELLFSNLSRIGPLGLRFAPETVWMNLTGLGLACLGVAVAVWARHSLGRYWSARVTIKEDHELIRSGPYAYVRHPIYSGMLLAAVGTTMVQGEWRGVLAVLLLFVTHTLKAVREEVMLAAEFGDEYGKYRRKTGVLLPRFVARRSVVRRSVVRRSITL